MAGLGDARLIRTSSPTISVWWLPAPGTSPGGSWPLRAAPSPRATARRSEHCVWRLDGLLRLYRTPHLVCVCEGSSASITRTSPPRAQWVRATASAHNRASPAFRGTTTSRCFLSPSGMVFSRYLQHGYSVAVVMRAGCRGTDAGACRSGHLALLILHVPRATHCP
jgi:hypothetical protein